MVKFEFHDAETLMRLTDAHRQTHPIYGIMGGIWPRANPQFVPPPGGKKQRTRADVAKVVEALGLKEPFVVSPITGGVCLLQVDDRNGTLCGAVCSVSTSMNRHMFEQHTGQIIPYHGPNKSGPHGDEANYESGCGLWKFVLDGEWRKAHFMVEPGVSWRKNQGENSEEKKSEKKKSDPPLIVQIARHLEHLAETDEDFDVARYGNKFLRKSDYLFFPTSPPPLPAGSKRTRSDLQDSDDEQKPPSTKRGRAARRGRGRGTAR